MAILLLAWKSLLNRRVTAALTLASIALSVTLLLGVERIRGEARASFASAISGTDLIVGARSGAVNLLLYAVFHIGEATNNLSWESIQAVAAHPRVDWLVPISLGDSHRGFRVMGTSDAFFSRYRYARDRTLRFSAGEPFSDLYDAVLGARVAADLGYRLGDAITVAHGASDVAIARHEDKPFRVAGILAPTGTPVDRTLFVSLEAIEAIHIDWHAGAPIPGLSVSAEAARGMDLTPKAVTAALVGLRSKVATFQVQRWVNEYPEEPLSAILPGVALAELWGLVGVAEGALLVVSGFVVVVGLFGMLTALMTSLNERRREMAILRSVGARPAHVFGLVIGEAGALTLVGVALGLGLLSLLLLIGRPLIESGFGIYLHVTGPSGREWLLIGLVVAAGWLIGAIPAYRAYRLSLTDGLSPRL